MNTLAKGHVNDDKGAWPDLVAVTVPGKLDTTTKLVPKMQAQLHERALARILGSKSIAGTTTFSEVIGNINIGYSERVLAILNEDSGRITFIYPSGEEVPALGEEFGRDDYIRFYPETLIGWRMLTSDAFNTFRTKAK